MPGVLLIAYLGEAHDGKSGVAKLLICSWSPSIHWPLS